MKINFRFILSAGIVALASLSSACSVFSGSAVFPTSDQDRKTVAQNFEKISSQVPYIQISAQTPHIRLYKVAFDGTLNDRSRVPKDEQRTIVAHIAELIGGSDEVHYYRGPGMQGRLVSLIDAMFGTSCIEVAQRAAEDYERVVGAWRAADPNVEVRIFVTGFSRGAATARHFMNLVSAKGVTDARRASTHPPKFYALLFDTVSTGQTDRLNLSLSSDLDYLIHFVALDESRPLFRPVIDVMPESRGGKPILGINSTFVPDRIKLVQMPGSHSDIGNAYRGGIGSEYMVLIEQILYRMGLHKKNCWDVSEDFFVEGKHDSRGILDKFIGIDSPNSYGRSSRRYIPATVADMAPDQYLSLIQRLDALEYIKRPDDLGMQTYRHKKAGLVLKLKRTNDVLEVQGVDEDVKNIIPESFVYTQDNGVRRLKFRRHFSDQENMLSFDDELWSYFPKDKNFVLDITRLERGGETFLATFVDNDLVRVTPSKQGETLVLSSASRGCQFAPDGQAISPFKMLILRAPDK